MGSLEELPERYLVDPEVELKKEQLEEMKQNILFRTAISVGEGLIDLHPWNTGLVDETTEMTDVGYEKYEGLILDALGVDINSQDPEWRIGPIRDNPEHPELLIACYRTHPQEPILFEEDLMMYGLEEQPEFFLYRVTSTEEPDRADYIVGYFVEGENASEVINLLESGELLPPPADS